MDGGAIDQLDEIRARTLAAIEAAADEPALEDIRVSALGKKGEISLRMRELGKMTPQERQTAGPALNALKEEIQSALGAKREAMADAALAERLKGEWMDVTLRPRPVQPPAQTGALHPISQVTEEVVAIFADLGFEVKEGPQVETSYYCFDSLNIP
ncbi:MAG: phenylalanine--tRNA ligase subunit alpha, partial [Pseudomonadota bacterium]